MEQLFEHLHRDHRNLSKLLRLLDDCVSLMERDEDPDYELMSDVIEYISTYPEAFHHPREDILYTFAVERDPAIRDDIDSILEQHVSLSKTTHVIREQLEAILNDAMVDRPKLIKLLRDFIDQQREHIRFEEAEVFPRIRAHLTTQDMESLDEQLPSRDDPLFGEKVETRFDSLYHQILTLSGSH
ncbi:MAG: hemerythrin domain-containing protein [bacterium]